LNEVQKELDNANFKILKDSTYDADKSFDFIQAELINLSDQGVVKPFNYLDQLDTGKFDQQVYNTLIAYLVREKKQLSVIIRGALDRRDLIYKALENDLGGEDAYLKFMDEYRNDKIANLLKNEHFIKSAVEIDNRLIRKKNLIYMEPLSRFGRAHFYAPVKKLGELSIDTYLFNLIFIWVTSFLFYLTLVFDMLRKFVNWTESVKLRKK